ncbi:MAG: helix-turn-helix domain-containing protein [Dokdonella sp.]|nr:helix-turn-helix domain-containing protein [Dokdonella sp.]
MSTASPTPLAHTIPSAARMLGIGRTSLYELMQRGELKTIRIGTRRLVPDSELHRYVASLMKEAA